MHHAIAFMIMHITDALTYSVPVTLYDAWVFVNTDYGNG